VSEIEPRSSPVNCAYELDPHGDVSDGNIMPALEATSSLDILEALEDGLDTLVEERGRASPVDNANVSVWRARY